MRICIYIYILTCGWLPLIKSSNNVGRRARAAAYAGVVCIVRCYSQYCSHENLCGFYTVLGIVPAQSYPMDLREVKKVNLHDDEIIMVD